MRKLLSIVISLLLALPLPAATIFVAQASAGGNTGANCANARAVSSLAAGDWSAGNAIHLCGTITSTIAAQGSGAMGNVISVIFETGASITVSNCGTNGCLGFNGRSYILVDGSPTATPCGYVSQSDVACNGLISATGNGSGSGNTDSVAIYTRGSTSNIEVRNLEIKGMYVHTCPNSSCNDTSATGNYYCLWDNGTSNNFHNLICHDALGGWKAEVGATSSNLSNSQLYNLNWSAFLSGPATNTPDAVTQDTIHDNDMHDWANWDTTSDTYHHDGCFAAGNNNLANGISHISCYNNYMHGSISDPTTCVSASGSCMTAPVFMNDGNNFLTYNNFIGNTTSGQFVNNGFIFYQSFGTLDANDGIYDNTVIGTNGTGGYCIAIRGDASMDFRNNVMSSCNQLLGVSIPSSGTTTFTHIDFNTYQNSSLTNAWQSGSNTYSTLANWRTAISGEASSQATTGSLGVNSQGIPQPGSILISFGTNLTALSITPLNSDANGSARPGGATAWDAGAFNKATTSTFSTPVSVIYP